MDVMRKETIEQAMCRQRTDEEDRAVQMCTMMRLLIDTGAREIRIKDSSLPDLGR